MLQQDPQQPELWINPAWNGREAGTFAVVIGISSYQYLTGTKETYDLGQLHVSALTAFRFFKWLGDQYRHPEKPLACCWLLLSPTAAERGVEPLMPVTPAPTFEACRKAIGQWFNKMETLDSIYLEKSRSMFFFSGHGLEITPAKQILLPSDYLEPPVPLVNRALSTDNLYTGLWALPVREHYLFLDACRNDNEDLRAASPLGTEVLNVRGPRYRPLANVISPIVYATGPGAAAWQPTNPNQGPSVFGQALMEGLECRPNMQPTCDDNNCWVTFRGLEDFLDPRVTDLLVASGTQVKQPIMIWGPTRNMQICVVNKPVPAPTILVPGTPPISPATRLVTPQLNIKAQMDEVSLPSGWRPSLKAGWGAAHNVVRSETLTDLLWHARVYDLQTGQESELKAGDKELLTIVKITRSTGSHRAYHVDVQVSGHSTYWVELESKLIKQKIACVLPGDKIELPRYTIEIDVDNDSITNFDVVLSPTNTELLGQAAALWGKFRSVDIEEAATKKELALLEQALEKKMRSPLAATVAALLLLRAWRHDLLHDWARNLAEYFPDRPDGCVVWAEQLLRTTESNLLKDVVPWLLRLNKAGLPHTAEGLGHAARQVPELLKFAFPDESRRSDKQQKQHAELTKLNERLTMALRVFRPGGLCATFIGRKEHITPDLLGTVDVTVLKLPRKKPRSRH